MHRILNVSNNQHQTNSPSDENCAKFYKLLEQYHLYELAQQEIIVTTKLYQKYIFN